MGLCDDFLLRIAVELILNENINFPFLYLMLYVCNVILCRVYKQAIFPIGRAALLTIGVVVYLQQPEDDAEL